jgi:PIN domain nuclease of toxin-antitoxin system
VLLWSSVDSLGEEARDLIERGATSVHVSAASIWEIEIKRATGRLVAPDDPVGLVRDSGFVPVPMTFEHAVEAGRLPMLHGDPFDRMLVAQARIEGLTLATADAVIGRYDVPTLLVAPG